MSDVMFPEPLDPMDRAMQRMDKKAWAEVDAEIATLKARLAEAETDAAYAQSLSLKLAAVENALFKIRNTAVDALNELIAVARGRECGACGRAIPPGGSTSCSLDHAALAPTIQTLDLVPCPDGSRVLCVTDQPGVKP